MGSVAAVYVAAALVAAVSADEASHVAASVGAECASAVAVESVACAIAALAPIVHHGATIAAAMYTRIHMPAVTVVVGGIDVAAALVMAPIATTIVSNTVAATK